MTFIFENDQTTNTHVFSFRTEALVLACTCVSSLGRLIYLQFTQVNILNTYFRY